MKSLRSFFPLAAGLALVTSAPAAVLYDLDFTPPEVGTYQTVFGNPTVQSSVGPFTDALVFHAVTTYDQIQLNTNVKGATSYDLQCDVLVHNLLSSNYLFDIIIDTPEVRTVDFNGLVNNLSVFQPGSGANLGPFANDAVYHLGLGVDLANNRLTVSVNGTQRYVNALNATSLSSIRFNMSPASGNVTSNAPTVYAALDNVVVTVVPEPGSLALVLAGMTGLWFCVARSRTWRRA